MLTQTSSTAPRVSGKILRRKYFVQKDSTSSSGCLDEDTTWDIDVSGSSTVESEDCDYSCYRSELKLKQFLVAAGDSLAVPSFESEFSAKLLKILRDHPYDLLLCVPQIVKSSGVCSDVKSELLKVIGRAGRFFGDIAYWVLDQALDSGDYTVKDSAILSLSLLEDPVKVRRLLESRLLSETSPFFIHEIKATLQELPSDNFAVNGPHSE